MVLLRRRWLWILTVPSLWAESLETDVLVSYSFTVDYIITVNLFNDIKIFCVAGFSLILA